MGTKIYSVLHRYVCLLTLVVALFLPSLSVTADAACGELTNVSVANVAPTSATLQWTVSGTGRHDYDIRVATQALSTSALNSATAETAGVVVCLNAQTLADDSYLLTDLAGGAHYYVYIRQNCEWDYDGTSAWKSCDFYTPCAATNVLPVSAGFDGATTLPSCWYASGITPVVQSSVHFGTSGNAVKLAATASEGSYLYSPVFTYDARAYLFSAQIYGRAGASYVIGLAPAGDLQLVEPIVNGVIATSNQWEAIDAIIPAALQQEVEQGTEYVWVIYCPSSDNAAPVYFDNILIDELPTCVAPSELAVVNATESSLTLSWLERGTATAWVVEYATATDTLTANASSNPFVLTGLEANTSYTIRVKAACSATEQSAWSKQITVKTPCGALALPLMDDFTGLTAGVPDCWDNSQFTCAAAYTWNYYATGFEGPCLRFNAYSAADGSTGTLISPTISNGDVTSLMLAYYLKNGGNATLDIYVSTDGGQTFPRHIVTAEKGSSQWTKYEVFFTAPANSSIVLKWVATSDYGSYRMDLDNVVVKAAPSCMKPTHLHIAALAGTEATLAWTPSGEETSWLLTYRLDSATVESVVVEGTPEYLISGLQNSSSYSLSQLSLQAICSATDTSDVASFRNINFRTPCANAVLPLDENFANGISECWTQYSYLPFTDGVSTASATPASYGDWNASFSVFTEGEAKINIYGESCQSWLVTPAFQVVSPQTNLSFDVALTKYNRSEAVEPGGQADDKFIVAISTDGFTWSMANATVWSNDAAADYSYDSISPTGDYYTLPLAAYAGQTIRVAFYGESTQYGGDNDLHLSNIVIAEPASCERPQRLTVAPISADELAVVIADADPTHTTWEIVVGEAGFNPAEATPTVVSAKETTISLPFSMLHMNVYEVYVRVACSATDKSAWRGPSVCKFIDYSSITNLPLQGVGDYPWEVITEDGVAKLQSTNQGINSSDSDIEATVIVPTGAEATVTFDYFASGEDYYDYLCIFIDEPNPGAYNYVTDFGTDGEAGGANGVTGSYTIYFTEPGTHTIRWRFHKDISSSYGADGAQVWNIRYVSSSAWAPKNLVLRSVSENSAEIAWDQCEGVIKNEVMLDSVSYETTTNSILFNDLTASTPYYLKVRSILENDTTDWSTFFFRTDCGASTIPFVESFELEGAELCWKIIGNAVEVTTTTAAFDGNKALLVANDSVAGMLVSPRLDASSLAEYEVSLAINLANVRYQGNLKPLTIGVMTNPSDVSTYIDLGDIVIPSAGSWKEYRFSLADLATPDYADWAGAQYVVVSMSDSATYYFDAITVAAPADCAKPTALDIQPNGEEVVVDWVSDATAHYAEIALGDNVIFAGEVAKPFIPQGLDANTIYKVRVRTICGADNSEWTPWTSFKTPCTYAELPFFEGFENYSATTFPDCWDKYIISGPGTAGFQVNTTSDSYYVHTGSRSLKLVDMQATTYSLAVLPVLNSPREGGLTLSFWMYRTTGSSHSEEGVRVWVNNVPSLEGATALVHVPRYGGVAGDGIKVEPVSSEGWYQYEKVLPISGPVYVMFEGISEYGSASYLDDIRIIETPTCVKPSDLHLGEVTATSAELAWSAGLDENQWQLIYKLSNKSVADTVLVTGTPSYTIEGLTPAATYTLSNISLQSICSDEDQSEVVNFAAMTIATLCEGALNLPYTQDFNAYTSGISSSTSRPNADIVYPSCWTILNESGDADSYPQAFLTSYANYVTSGKSFFVKMSSSTPLVAVLPEMNVVPDAQLTVEFTYRNEGTSEYNGHVQLGYVTDPSDAESFVQLQEYECITTMTEVSEQITLPENAQIAFRFVGGTGNNYYASVDEIVVSVLSSCQRPEAVNVVGVATDAVTLAVVDPEGAAWEYAVGSMDATPVAVTNAEFEITGLEPQTEYTVFVRRTCGNEVSAWRSVSFKTHCVAVTAVSEDFEDAESGTSGDHVPDCWTLMGTTDSSYPYITAYGAHSGSHCLYAYSSVYSDPVTACVALPLIDGDLSQYRLRLYAKASSVYDGPSPIFVICSNTTDYAQMVADTLNYDIINNGHPIVPTTDYQEYVVSLADYQGDGNVVALYLYELASSIYIDDVVLELIPSCDYPQGVSVLNVTSTAIDVLITDTVAAHNAWEVVAVAHGASPATGTPVLVNTKAATITATFASGSEYDVYVRTVCGEDETSDYVNLATFRFVDYSAATDLPVMGVGDYPWTIVYEDGVTKLQSTNQGINSSESDLEATFVIPEGQMGELSFDYYASGEGSSYMYDYLCVYLDPNNPSSSDYLTDLGYFGMVGTPSGMGGTYTIQLTPGTHTVRWRFHKDSSSSDGADMGQIWNLQMNYLSFFVPSNLGVENVSADAATLTWSACNDAVLNEVRFISEADTLMFQTEADSLLVSDLTEETAYSFAVRSINADNDTTAWSAAYAFTTPAACVKPQGIEVLNVSATQVDIQILDFVAANHAWQVAFGSESFNPDAEGALILDVENTLVAINPAQPLISGNAYDIYVRTVCGDDMYSVWTAVKTVKYFDVSGVSNIDLNMNEGDYPWEVVVDAEDGISKLQSTNQGIGASNSDLTATFVIPEDQHGTLTFNYYAEGEGESPMYDYLCIYVDKANPNESNYINTIGNSGRVGTPNGMGGTYSIELTAGTHTIRWRFHKDGGIDNGADQGQVWNINLHTASIVRADTIYDATCDGSDYIGYGFNLTDAQLRPGYNYFEWTKPAVSDLEADTIFTLSLFVSRPSTQLFTDTVCAHEHYTGYGFDIADVDPLRTSYQRTLTNMYGCDSTVTLRLFVPQTEFEVTEHLCEGQTYLFGDSVITTSGVYVRTYQNIYGCDSIITLRIFFHATSATIQTNICQGEAYEFGGQMYSEAGTYTHTFQNAAGCDSVVTLTLSVIEPVVSYYDGVFCEGSSFAGGDISPKFIGLNQAGTYTDTIQSLVTGCDSVLVLNLVEEKIQHSTVTGTYSEGRPFVYNGHSYQEAGTFEVVLSTVNGCDSIITLVVTYETAIDNLAAGQLQVAPNPAVVGQDVTILSDLQLADDYKLRVYDAVGKLVYETSTPAQVIPGLPTAGVYTVRITTGTNAYQAKLIVK